MAFDVKYYLFVGDDYYAAGGWHDFRGVFITLEDAITIGMELITADKYKNDWGHIVESDTLTIVAQYIDRVTSDQPIGIINITAFITPDHEHWQYSQS